MLSKEELAAELKVKSVAQIAREHDTYPNKIRRHATKLGLAVPNMSEVQKRMLDTGEAVHPTKGKRHRAETRILMSESQADAWTDERKVIMSKKSKENWDKMDRTTKLAMISKANKAVRKAAQTGSKLERYLLEKLLEAGYLVDFHRENMFSNELLQVDLLVKDLKVAIEVDGPSHFEPIWGQKAFSRTKRADKEKNGHLIQSGYKVIRLKHPERLSQKNMRDSAEILLNTLKEIADGKLKKEIIKLET